MFKWLFEDGGMCLMAPLMIVGIFALQMYFVRRAFGITGTAAPVCAPDPMPISTGVLALDRATEAYYADPNEDTAAEVQAQVADAQEMIAELYLF